MLPKGPSRCMRHIEYDLLPRLSRKHQTSMPKLQPLDDPGSIPGEASLVLIILNDGQTRI